MGFPPIGIFVAIVRSGPGRLSGPPFCAAFNVNVKIVGAFSSRFYWAAFLVRIDDWVGFLEITLLRSLVVVFNVKINPQLGRAIFRSRCWATCVDMYRNL